LRARIIIAADAGAHRYKSRGCGWGAVFLAALIPFLFRRNGDISGARLTQGPESGFDSAAGVCSLVLESITTNLLVVWVFHFFRSANIVSVA